MTFDELFFEISKRQGPGFGAGLCAFSQLLTRLKNPQNSFQIIHVAGTNGKGTVCTLLAHVLTRAGYQTGLFVSPHLISPTERISIDGKNILPRDFFHAIQTVLKQEKEPLNCFEILTAAALLYFAEQKVKYAVLETGLGGRKDPTNVCVPCLSIITSVGLDHTHLLGNTLTQIAVEKAGIIKPGIPVLCGYLSPGVARVVAQRVRQQNAPLKKVCFQKPHGDAQRQNVQLVRYAAEQLGVEADALSCLEKVSVPGRFEIIKTKNNQLILDGAHNPPAMENLLTYFQSTPYAKETVLVCGFMKDKDYKKMLNMLYAHFTRILVTQPPSARAAGENELAEFLTRPGVEFLPDYKDALSRACMLAPHVLCTGSFYLVGAVRRLVKK